MGTSCNYPPDEILNPIIGKPNYEYIILWILSNNEVCSWSELKEKVNKSTLSNYLRNLKREGCVTKGEFNQYSITSKGRERYYELGQIEDVVSYTSAEAMVQLLKHEHWGPWDDVLVSFEVSSL